MSAIFILGELGECFSQQSLIPFTKLIERYFPDNYQSFSDIFTILDSNGNIIEQLPQNILIMGGDPSTKYYLYSKSFNNEIYANIFEECINKVTTSSSFTNPINIPNFPELYQYIDEKLIISSSNPTLKHLTAEDIKHVYDSMQEFYKNFHVIYNTMKINSRICEKIKECYSYQYCGIKCMTKYINDIQTQCEKSKDDAKNEFNRLIEIKDESIESMEKSLNILKSLELHPKMQVNDKRKYLIDIYYPEDKMKIWKDNCIEKTTFFKNYFNEKTRLFVNENNKIVKEKSTVITELKNEWNVLGGEYDNIITTIENKINVVYNDLSNEFMQFKDAITKIVELLKTNNNTNNIDECCKVIIALKNKYSSFDVLDKLSDSLEPLNDLCSKMRKSMERVPQRINNLILTFESMGNTISELTDKFISLSSNRLLELESSFETFFYPSYFPEAYDASINEIKRRIKVNAVLNKLLDMFNQIKKTENEHRKEFLSKYGKFLPSEFYPNLKSFIKYQQDETSIDDDTETFPNLFTEDELQLFIDQLNIPDPFNNNNSNNSNLQCSSAPAAVNAVNNNEQQQHLIETLKKEKDNLYDTIQKINDDFILLSSMKDKQLTEKKTECDNLLKKLLSKVNIKYDNCPMCLERSISNGDYQSWSTFTKELQRKINDRDKAITVLEKKIESVIMQTTRIKKSFFDHMNYTIVKKNNDINELKSKIDLLTTTTTTSNSVVSNKLENELIEVKDILDKEKIKSQRRETDIMLLQQKYDKILNDYKKCEMKLNDVELQLNKKSEQYIKLLQEQSVVKKENEKLITKCKNENIKKEQIQTLLMNTQNELKILKLKNDMNNNNNDGVVNIKTIQKGIRCIFVPYSEGAYACIHFGKGDDSSSNSNSSVFILNMEVFDEELKDIVVDNSLIVIGVVDNVVELDKKNRTINNSSSNVNGGAVNINAFNEEDKVKYYLVTLAQIEYVIGVDEEDLVLKNYYSNINIDNNNDNSL